ncbi:MAG: glutaminase, partial [Cyanobacteriota bacterium]
MSQAAAAAAAPGWISTGHLPTEAVVRQLVAEAHRRLGPVGEGKVATYIPALAAADPALFGVCVAATGGQLFEAGDTVVPFSIQSVSKPFLFGLICQAIGE